MDQTVETLDGFDVIARLTGDADEAVFLARVGDERLVALEQLHPHGPAEQRRVLELVPEVALLSQLEHPHVLRVLEMGASADRPYLVSEYVEGITLARLLALAAGQERSLPVPAVVRVMLDALAGLHAVHQLADEAGRAVGFVHRGVSPHAILVGLDGTARVAVVGLSHRSSYLAPEQVRGESLDRRADVFAAGVVMWECVAGRRLFGGTSQAKILAQVLGAPIPRLDQVAPVPGGLAAVCARTLERDVTWRYGSAAELAEALEGWALDHGLVGERGQVAALVDEVAGTEIAERRRALGARPRQERRRRGLAAGSDIALPVLEAPPPQPQPTARHRLPSPPPPPPAVGSAGAGAHAHAPAASARARAHAPAPAPASTPAPAAPPAPVTSPPPRFGKYAVVRHLADGGMAEVYLARAQGIEGFAKTVVVKRLRPELARKPWAVNMFLQEARIAATLDHPQIAQVHDIGEVNGSFFFAMEHVHGQDLRRIMRAACRRGRSIPLEEALRVVTELCGALHHAHDKRGPDGRSLGLVHRDVSPSNVLVSYDGAIKLCDFGVVEVTAAADPAKRVRAGKLSYMSPEQCQGLALDRRSDLFVLAVVLYELTTLRKLFKGSSEREVVRAIMEGWVPRPTQIRPDYPPELERIVMKGLSVDPADRYATAQEMRLDLEAFARERRLALTALGLSRLMDDLFPPDGRDHDGDGDLTDGGTTSDFDQAAPVAVLRRRRRRPGVWLLAAAIAAALAVVTVPLERAQPDPRAALASQVTQAADRMGARLDAAVRAMQARAVAVATTPMLRAAITTDAHTLEDMVAHEPLLSPGSGEVFEFYRWRGGSAQSLLRVPRDAPAAAALPGGTTRVEVTGGRLVLASSAAVQPLYRNQAVTGALVVSATAGGRALSGELPRGAADAVLKGPAGRIELQRPRARRRAGRPVRAAIPLDPAWAQAGLVLEVAGPPARWSAWPAARGVAAGLSLMFAALFLIRRRTVRPRRRSRPGGLS